jgi:uncharacterized metal-binding protein
MPSGLTHSVITTVAAAGLYYALPQAGFIDPMTTYTAMGGCMAGVLLTPDLDVDNASHSHYVVLHRFGMIPFIIWRAIWYPYGVAIGHRSWVSHMPIISTLIRLAYLALIAWGVFALFGYTIPWRTWAHWPMVQAYAYPAVAGLMLSDALHWLADITSTGIKRRLHRRRHGRYQGQNQGYSQHI